MNISPINTATPKSNVNFNGAAKAPNPILDGMATKVAEGFSKIGNSDKFVNLMEKSMKSDKFTTHLSTASSAVTCGLYVYRAATDKKKSKNEKITQVINQFLTFGISTALSYTVTGALNNKVKDMTGKFGEAIAKKGYEPEKVEKLKAGAKAAVDLVICSSINRFFVPVGVTPIANKFGKKLCAKMDERDAQKAQAKLEKQA